MESMNANDTLNTKFVVSMSGLFLAISLLGAPLVAFAATSSYAATDSARVLTDQAANTEEDWYGDSCNQELAEPTKPQNT